MYRAIDVWERIGDAEAVRFRCFLNLRTGMYSVQSSDFYSLPVDKRRVEVLEDQYVELLIEKPPDERAGAFATLESAITAHMEKFRKT